MKNLTEGEKMVCRGCCHCFERTDMALMPYFCRLLNGQGVSFAYRAGTAPNFCPLKTAKEVLK